MAPIPDMTNNTQNTIIHVLILLCSLFMISSCSAGPAVDNSWKRASGRLGHFPARLRGDHNDTLTDEGQPRIPLGRGRAHTLVRRICS